MKMMLLHYKINIATWLQEGITVAMMTIGAPACGMNSAIRSFVRMSLTAGLRVLGVHYGIEGLLQDQV